MSEHAIETTQLRKEFGSNVAVANLSLQVRYGEVFGFLGPNGAGKTTSVKMLLGLTAPTAGDAKILGRDLNNRAARAHIGYLPEHFGFYRWLKGHEFLRLHGQLYGMDKAEIERQIPILLERVGLKGRDNLHLEGFSKGMLQRIGLAQAIMNKPKLIFLDEPTSGLDPLGRRLVRELIGELAQQGTAVFLNSHLLSEVEQSCDRVTFIRKGKILATHNLHEFDSERVTVRLRLGEVTADVVEYAHKIGDDLGRGDDNSLTLTLPNEAAIPPFIHWLATHNHAIYELSQQKLSLEDRFLQIVGENSGDVD